MDTKKALAAITVASVLFAAAGFAAGTYYTKNRMPGPGDMPPNATGGPMSQLSDEDRAALDSMGEDERRAYLDKDSRGVTPGGQAAAGGSREDLFEGQVIEVADQTVTVRLADSGSQTVYLNEGTTVARADGSSELAVGQRILVMAEHAADGVTAAHVIVIR